MRTSVQKGELTIGKGRIGRKCNVLVTVFRLVHTTIAMPFLENTFLCRCRYNVSTFTCWHETHFFRCRWGHNWVQNPFHDDIKIMKILSLPSQCERALYRKWLKKVYNWTYSKMKLHRQPKIGWKFIKCASFRATLTYHHGYSIFIDICLCDVRVGLGESLQCVLHWLRSRSSFLGTCFSFYFHLYFPFYLFFTILKQSHIVLNICLVSSNRPLFVCYLCFKTHYQHND